MVQQSRYFFLCLFFDHFVAALVDTGKAMTLENATNLLGRYLLFGGTGRRPASHNGRALIFLPAQYRLGRDHGLFNDDHSASVDLLSCSATRIHCIHRFKRSQRLSMLTLDDHWVWDAWYLNDGECWHCWYLKAPRSIGDPARRHWHVSQGHAISVGLVNWDHRGTAMSPSKGPAFDDMTTWTGCTLRGGDDLWHYFYTGTSQSEDAKIQRIGHAVGNDLKHWQRVDDGLCLDISGPNAELYETAWQGRWHDRAMRDPWIMKDPHAERWLMYFTARVSDREEPNDAGCIGFATSPDLYHWQLEPPVFTGGWGQLEVPQVFEYKGYWYCLFCTDPQHQAQWHIERYGVMARGSHYLIADNLHGPWRLPDGPVLDTAVDRYAARIVDHGGLQILGFKDAEDREFGGYIMDPVPVYQSENGLLSLQP